jgi:hypothetical protein
MLYCKNLLVFYILHYFFVINVFALSSYNQTVILEISHNRSKYIKCINNKFVEYSCPLGQIFDRTRKICEKQEKIFFVLNNRNSSINSNKPMTTSVKNLIKVNATNNYIESVYCTKENEYLSLAYDCSKFKRCVHGLYVEAKCPAGTLFDYLKKECEHISIARCESQIINTNIVSSDFGKLSNTYLTTTSIKTSNNNINHECTEADDFSGIVGDCAKFLRCIYFEFVVFECAPGIFSFSYFQNLINNL